MLKNKKNILVFLTTSVMSMVAGVALGCMKEKIVSKTRCIIDEM